MDNRFRIVLILLCTLNSGSTADPCSALIGHMNFEFSGVAEITRNGDAFINHNRCDIIITSQYRDHEKFSKYYLKTGNEHKPFHYLKIRVRGEILPPQYPHAIYEMKLSDPAVILENY